MGTKYSGHYSKKKKRLIDLWKNKSLFGLSYVDMSGLLNDEKNFVSIHHLYNKDGKCTGLAVIGRCLHNYIDDYLKRFDIDEYYKWNSYLEKVFNKTFYNCKEYSNEALKFECKILIKNILLNCDINSQKYRSDLLCYISTSLIYNKNEVSELLENIGEYLQYKSVYEYLDVINRIKNNSYYQKDRLRVSKEESAEALIKYKNKLFVKMIEDYWINSYGSIDVLHQNLKNNLNVTNEAERVSEDEIVKASNNYIVKNSLDAHLRYDWMGNKILLTNQSESNEIFVTVGGLVALDVIKDIDSNLYHEWNNYFSDILNNNKKEAELYSELKCLRKKSARLFSEKYVTNKKRKYLSCGNAFQKKGYLQNYGFIPFNTYKEGDFDLEIEANSYTRKRV